MQKVYSVVELQDGSILPPERITLPDRIRYETAARANGWNAETTPVTAQAFLAWAATERAGHHALPWDEFITTAVEATATQDEDQPTVPPTNPAPIAGS